MNYKIIILLVTTCLLAFCGNTRLKKNHSILPEPSTSLQESLNGLKNNELLLASTDQLTSVEWTNAAGKKEVIVKEDGLWHYAGMEAVDSAAFETYLTALVNARGSEFSDLSLSLALSPGEKLILYTNTMTAPTVISAYIDPEHTKSWIIHSSANPEVYFVSDSSGIYKRIFSDLTDFWP